MKKILIYSLSLVASISMISCDIDRLPTGHMPSEDITGDPEGLLEYTLNGAYGQLKAWSDPMHRCGEYAGDNMMIRGSSTDAFYEFISYNRTSNNYRLSNFWDFGYKAVAQTSNVINMISEEGASAEILNSLGECYYVRGLTYFYFVRAFGRPYYDNPDRANGGVPIVNGTPDDMFNLALPDRATVKETYLQITTDLRKAISLMTVGKKPLFATAEAAEALLSRVYLYMSGTYEAPNAIYADSSVYFATQVIESGKYSLLPREEFMKYNTKTPENNKETIFAVKRVASEYSGNDHYGSIGGMYGNIGGMGWGEMYASKKYLDLLDETGRNNWRTGKIVDARANFIAPQYSDAQADGRQELVFRFVRNTYNAAGTQTAYDYAQDSIVVDKATGAIIYGANGTITTYIPAVPAVPAKDDKPAVPAVAAKSYTLTPVDAAQEIYSIVFADGVTYEGVLDYRMKLNRAYPMFYIEKCSKEGEDSHLHSPVISRLGEVYMNRAEAYAKLGNYPAALTDLNEIRTRSLPGEGYGSLNAANASELIDKERQLELAFQAERSYDVYRNGGELTRDYPGPQNAMEVVKPNDFRTIYFIPQDAINSYPGTLTQNPTS